MNSLDTDFHRRIAQRLDEETEREIIALASGVLEYHDYKRICGRIKALQDVKDWCADIEKLMSQGK